MALPVVRAARPEDIPAIREVARAAWSATYTGIVDAPAQREVIDAWYADAALAAVLGRPGSWFHVAEVGGEVAGFSHAVLGDDGRGDLARLYVHPQRQGSGIGSRLLAEALRALAGAGVREARVPVARDNRTALEFYERRGFRKVGAFQARLPGGQEVPHLLLALTIAGS